MLHTLIGILVMLNGFGAPWQKTPARSSPISKNSVEMTPFQIEQVGNYHQGIYRGKIIKVSSPLPESKDEEVTEPQIVPLLEPPAEDEGLPGRMYHKWTYEEPGINQLESPAMITHFEGITYTGWAPPDVQVAANSSYVVEVVNSYIQIFDKAGNTLYGASLYSFFSTLNPSINMIFDPKIAYDPDYGRWIVLALFRNTGNLTSYYYLAVSQTSNPTGAWNFYALDATVNGSTPSNTWADYPGLGFNDWGIFITSNQYSWSNSYQYSRIRILDKLAAYSGTLSSFFDIWGVSYASSWKPAQSMSSTTTEFIMRSSTGNSSYIRVWKLTGSATSPALSTTYQISVRSYQSPPDASQRGGNQPLDTGSCKMQDVTYYNGVLYGSFTEKHPSVDSLSTVRYLEIDTTMTVIKDVTIGDTNINYFYPRVAVTPNFTVLTCAVSSDSIYAGFAFTVRELPSGTFSAFTWVKQGYSYYYHPDAYGRNRWGDYFGAYADLSDSSIWIAGQYATSSGDWSTHIAEIRDTAFSGAPDLVIDSMIIDDDNNGSSIGNGNGIAESGESIEMMMRLQNNGNATATNVSAVLRTQDTTIAIIDSTETYPSIAPGNGEWCYNNFDFNISPTAPTHYAEFVMDISSDQGSWSDTFQIPIYQPTPSPPPSPYNVVAGDGFQGVIPLTWSDSSESHIYKIYRSLTSGGPYLLLDSIDVQNRNYYPCEDYVDDLVVPGTEYFYVITSIRNGMESGYSAEVSAIPSDTGWVFHSAYSDIPPLIDGFVLDPEWADAESMLISNPWNPYPVVFKAKNDSTNIYFAIIAYGMPSGDNIDVGFLYDLGNDGMWPPDTLGPTTEGCFSFFGYGGIPGVSFWSVYGTYPDSISTGYYTVTPPGVMFALDTSSGSYMAEISIDMTMSTMATFPGDTVGFWMYFMDYLLMDTTYYGFAGSWPFGAVWIAPHSYGDLVIGNAGSVSMSDTLLLESDTTAPGSEAEVPVVLINQNTVGGIQFVVAYETLDLALDTVVIDTTLTNFSLSYNDSCDSVIIMIVSMSGDTISPGTHTVATIKFSVDSSMSTGDSTRLYLSDVVLSDPLGSSLPVYSEGTWVYVLGLKGDLNQDGVVNVLDVVRAINIALGRPPAPTSYEQWAGDMNDDGTINVLDIVAMINVSLGGSKIAGLENGRADLRIENNRVVVNSTVPLAGIQLELSGEVENPELLVPGARMFWERSGDVTRIIVVNLNGNVMPAGESALISFDGSAIVKNAVIADPAAEKVNVSFVPPVLKLNPVNPNPVRGSGVVSFILPEKMLVKLRIMDVSGRVVTRLVDESLSAGTHSVRFGHLRSGVYFIELIGGSERRIGKFVVR